MPGRSGDEIGSTLAHVTDTPPTATRIPHEHTEHGIAGPDPYFWMGAGGDELLGHLAAERAYYDASCAHLQPLTETLRAEMAARVPGDETSPVWHRERYSYASRTAQGSEYADLVRVPAGGDVADADVFLDVNALAEGADYLELGVTIVSPDEDLLAWSVDRTGDEVYELRFRDLRTGTDLEDAVPRTYYGGAWSADSQWFFYTVHDQAYRPFQVWRHRIGTPVTGDVLVLEEPDERFDLNVRATRSGGAILILSESRDTGETWAIDATAPESSPRSVGGRRPGVLYRAEHVRESDVLLLVTNDDAVEFRLMSAPLPHDADQDHTSWSEVRPELRWQRLLRADAFASCVLLTVREDGKRQIVKVPHDDLAGSRGYGLMVSDEPDGDTVMLRSPRYDAEAVTVLEESWLRPGVAVSWPLDDGLLDRVWFEEAPGHDPTRYLSERRTFPSADGTEVPATILRHRDTPLDGTAAALVYGYGAYEAVDEPTWDPALPSLLDRGVVYVDRPHPWRRRGRSALVAGRPDGAQAAHVRRPRRRGRRTRARRSGRRRPDRHAGAERRRPAAGRGLQPAAGPVARGRG